MPRTRRGLLALLVGSSGCLGLGGGGNAVTPGEVEDTPSGSPTATTSAPTRTGNGTVAGNETVSPTTNGTATTPGNGTASPTETPPPTATRTPTETASPTPTETPSPTATPTETPTATPTPTPRAGQAPPPGSLQLVGTTVTVESDSGQGLATATASLRNAGSVTFTYVELRFDLYYSSLSVSRRQVASGYVGERFDGFGPGSTQTFTAELAFSDGRLDGNEPDSNYEIEIQYRIVEYE